MEGEKRYGVRNSDEGDKKIAFTGIINTTENLTTSHLDGSFPKSSDRIGNTFRKTNPLQKKK